MLRFFTWKSFERLLRFDRVFLETVLIVLVPMLCMGMGSGGSTSRISGRAALERCPGSAWTPGLSF
jgi:hypothetical protein